MNFQESFLRSKALNNIPNKKLNFILEETSKRTDINQQQKNLLIIAANKYSEANIPIEYWNLNMNDEFKGDKRLFELYSSYTSDLKKSFLEAKSFCLAGSHGLGKTMTVCCILKECIHKNYDVLYTTLSDVVNVLTSASTEEKFFARRELCLADFLAIDEFDSRFIASDNAADLYARTLESIFRTRSQNKLPTLMSTNSPNIVESFNGPLKDSIKSLVSGYLTMFPVFGKDFRIKK